MRFSSWFWRRNARRGKRQLHILWSGRTRDEAGSPVEGQILKAPSQEHDHTISELGEETFIAHNVLSPYREFVLKVFQERGVRLNMDIEMPTVETIRWMVESNQGVAFLPRMCVEQEISEKRLVAVRVPEIELERKIYLVQPSRRAVSYAGEAFLKVVMG